ncbi:hypothetical protein L2E82_14070 [Cichorium intybus]|uniref:Uncharacterized protein n=1 Tax=Cichorium intybus TaxID=13427 RepID=A0ACB9EZ24_CICIN|nr:hypothetical protein L2E82_14070 [Cichorium intybus]
MTSTLQLKLRGISLANDLPEKLSITVDDILNQIVFAVNNFFQYLIGLFNKEFPPDTPRPWFDVAAPYLIAAVAFITCLCICHCLFWCISSILIRCFNVFLRCFGRCLCCGGESDSEEEEEERMMIAPGRSPLMLPRTAFEANPRGYFRDLRGKPNDFSYSISLARSSCNVLIQPMSGLFLLIKETLDLVVKKPKYWVVPSCLQFGVV